MDSKGPLLGEWNEADQQSSSKAHKEEPPRSVGWKWIARYLLLMTVVSYFIRNGTLYFHVDSPHEQPGDQHGDGQRPVGTLEDQFFKVGALSYTVDPFQIVNKHWLLSLSFSSFHPLLKPFFSEYWYHILSTNSQIVPSEKLKWHPCSNNFGSFQCARLTVPMDYNRPLNASTVNPKVHLALLMVPGAKSVKTGKYSTSPLLINPGGPGGSGTAMVAGFGTSAQQIIDADQDVVGFDPRGVGFTTPQANCWAFPSEDGGRKVSQVDFERGEFNRIMFTMTGQSIGIVNTSEVALSQWDERARLIAGFCQSNDAIHGEDSILRHVSTPAVAQDMISIIDAWDEWRDQTNQSMAPQNCEGNEDRVAESEIDSNPSTKGQLVYWGFSYGTLLGATFASMFPDRVGRVILDGVVDADYYVGPIWGDSLRDADAVENSFFKYCHEAEGLCTFYHDGDKEVDIKTRFFSIMEKLKINSIRGINHPNNVPTIITYSHIKSMMFQGLYFPAAAFPAIAQILEWLYQNDNAQLLDVAFHPFQYKPFCEAQYFPRGLDAQGAIMCSDKRYPVINQIYLSSDMVSADIFSSMKRSPTFKHALSAWPTSHTTQTSGQVP
jgi:pimeloyl-ACP methyl ester carboxylesterase